MGYIEDIRKLVGNTPLILSSAGVILTNETGQVLLSFRNDTEDWGLPGGYMELGETLEDTAVRELHEEMNITVRNLELFNIFSGPDFQHIYPNGDVVHSVITVFLASEWVGEIGIDNKEIRAFQFFHLSDLPEKMTKTTGRLLAAYKIAVSAD